MQAATLALIPIIGAVDIGGTKIAVGVVDTDGKVLSRMETPTAVDRSYEDDLQLVVSMLRKTFQDAGKKIEGIGGWLSSPGQSCYWRIRRDRLLLSAATSTYVFDLNRAYPQGRVSSMAYLFRN